MTSITEDHVEDEESDSDEESKEVPAQNQAAAQIGNQVEEIGNQVEIIIDTRPVQKKKAEPIRFVSPLMRPRPRNDKKSQVLSLLCNPGFSDVYDWEELDEREIPDEEIVETSHIEQMSRAFEFQGERAKNFGKPIF